MDTRYLSVYSPQITYLFLSGTKELVSKKTENGFELQDQQYQTPCDGSAPRKKQRTEQFYSGSGGGTAETNPGEYL